jgi:stage V sporulation protein D (sporulation-specific penicillin-binding protein)
MTRKKQNIDENKVRRMRLKRRIFVIEFFFIVFLIYLAGQIAHIKIYKGEEYERAVLARRSSSEQEIQALRGTIVDRNAKTLATSTLVYHIIIDPKLLLSSTPEQQQMTYEALAAFSQKPLNEVQEIVEANPTARYRIFHKNVLAEEIELLKENKLVGVWFEEGFIRNYPKKETLAQVLGFYNGTNGQYGVEQYYNDLLSGISGRVFPEIGEGNLITTQVIPATSGNTLVLTIDEIIQQYVEQAMKNYIERYEPLNAAAIAMNPKTGEIYAMFSYPYFDPASYTNLLEQVGEEAWGKLSSEEKSELLNRAWKNYNIHNPYEPGSTFKPLMVSMAIEEGLLDPNKTYECNGSIQVADTRIRCWHAPGHGIQTWQQVLANSCNPGTIEISQAISNTLFAKYMHLYGFGETTRIDLPGEEIGMIYNENRLGPVEKATNSMGQTFTATPLQMITAFSALVNGGYLMEPHIVSQVIDSKQSIVYEKNPTIRRQVISEATSYEVRQALEKAVLQGTGSNASVLGYQVGGKTGTAEKLPREDKAYIYSFIGFAPVNDPQIVVLTLFDEIEESTGAPTRVFREMMENILPYMGIPTNTNLQTPLLDLSVVADVKGKTIYEAHDILSNENLQYELIGSGITVVDQYPAAGTALPKGGSVKLYLQTENLEEVILVPDLMGKNIQEAKELLGEDFILVSNNEVGMIRSQVPKAGVKIEKGNSIIVQTIE